MPLDSELLSRLEQMCCAAIDNYRMQAARTHWLVTSAAAGPSAAILVELSQQVDVEAAAREKAIESLPLCEETLLFWIFGNRQFCTTPAAAHRVRCPFAPRGPSPRHGRSTGRTFLWFVKIVHFDVSAGLKEQRFRRF
jgi:hypothetical protein